MSTKREIFLEVLRDYEHAEQSVINDRSINAEEDLSKLEQQIADWQRLYDDAEAADGTPER